MKTWNGGYGAMAAPPAQVTAAGIPNDPFGDWFLLKQKVTKRDLIENTMGVELGNFYTVAPKDAYGGDMAKLYIDERDSNWCGRICCGPNRGATFDVFYGAKAAEGGSRIISLKKDFVCQCCACCCCICTSFCKPRIDVYAAPQAVGGAREIGYVQDHCVCCGTREEIYQASGEHAYTIKGSACQLGACCPAGFDAKYEITDTRTGAKGLLTKDGSGVGNFVKDLLADAQTYIVKLPEGATPDDKTLLLAGSMMVELVYYEDTNDKPNELGGIAGGIAGAF
eukprot:g6189.t1